MEDKRFTLRLDKEIFDRISGLAEQHRRSTAKEIEQAIAMYLEFQDIEENFGNAGLSDTDLDCEKTFQIKNAYRRFPEDLISAKWPYNVSIKEQRGSA